MAENAATPTPSVTMYDANGSPVSVPTDQVQSALQSGTLGFKEDQTVYVQRDSTSPLVPMRGAEAVQTFSTYRPENISSGFGTADAFQDQEDRARYGGVAGTAATAAQGAFSGVTFGLGDAVTVGLGEALGYGGEARDFVEKGAKVNPNARLLGEVAGALAPAIASAGTSAGASGASLAARGATALGRAGMAAGAAVEGAAARGLARTGIAALGEASIGGRALAAAAGQAAEGALYGVGDAVSRAVVRNEDLTAEHVLSGGLMGAALGAAGGAVVGGGLAAASMAGSGLLGAVEKVTGIAGAEGRATSQRVAGLVEHMTEGTSTGKSLQTLAEGFADRATLRATGAGEETAQRLLSQGDSVTQRAVKQLSEDIPAHAGSRTLGATTPARMAEAAEKNLVSKTERASSLLKEVDSLGERAAATPLLKRDLIAPLTTARDALEQLGHKRVMGTVDQVGLELSRLAPSASIAEVQRAVAPLAEMPLRGLSSEGKAAIKTALDSIESGIFATASARAEGAGAASLTARLSTALDDRRAATWIADAAREGAERGSVSLGLGDAIQALSSATHALAAGNPALLATLVGGAVVAQAKRSMGQQVAADIAQRAVRSDAIQALSAMMDGRVKAEVGGFFTRSAQKASAVAGAARRAAPIEARRVGERKEDAKAKRKRQSAEYQRAVEQVRSLQSSPQRVQEATAGLSAISPTLAAKAAERTTAAASFLASKVPVTKGSTAPSLTPHLDAKRMPPSAEMVKFMAYHRAVLDPTSALGSFRKGTMTPEQVEVLRSVYPETLRTIQSTVREHLAELRTELPYAKQVALGSLLGVPVAASQDPAFVSAAQQAIAGSGGGEQGQGGGGPPPRAPSRPIKVAERVSLGAGF